MPKKPKLTPEEKKALRIQKRQERKRKAEERKRQLQRDRLSRELHYSAGTIRKYEKKWRDMLMKIALPRVRDELQFSWNSFERVVDCKDFAISLLLDELKDAEEQYMMNFRSHVENIDRLITMFRDRLDELKEDYENSIKEMQDEAVRQVDSLMSATNENEEFLKMMLYGLEQQLKDDDRQIKIEYVARTDETESKYVEKIQRMRVGLEQIHQRLWDSAEAFAKQYFINTKERRQKHDALQEQDNCIQDLIEFQLQKIIKATELIKKLREKLSDLQTICGMKINDLEIERNFFHSAFFTLKLRLEEDRKLDKEQLRLLTIQCHETLDYLKEIKRKGEFILQMGVVCRKMETQKEKIIPFPTDMLSDMPPVEDPIWVKGDKVDRRMNLFWQRVAQANAVRFALNEEKLFLTLEDKVLVDKLNSKECGPCNYKEKDPNRRPPNLIDAKQELRKYVKQSGYGHQRPNIRKILDELSKPNSYQPGEFGEVRTKNSRRYF